MIRSGLQFDLLPFHCLNLNIESFAVVYGDYAKKKKFVFNVCVSHFLQTPFLEINFFFC